MPDELPSPASFFLDEALYEPHLLGDWNAEYVARLEFFDGTLDTYCVQCERGSTFQRVVTDVSFSGPNSNLFNVRGPDAIVTNLRTEGTKFYGNPKRVPLQKGLVESLEDHAFRESVFIVDFACTRNDAHQLAFFFSIIGRTIEKVGQVPSLADLQDFTVRKYKPVLGNEKYRELTKGIGLFAHGIGIGSFVYLRRIFEDLIERAHLVAQTDAGWDEGAYQQARMDDKIKLLRLHLPDFLYNNRAIYSILSVGIHSLSEDDCKKHFPIVKVGIELILDELLADHERKLKIEAATKALVSAKGEITKA